MLKKNLIVMKKNMKINLVVLLILSLVSCTSKVNYTENKIKCVVDSVEFHGIGQDNSLQTTPYWKIHLKESDIWVRTQNTTSVGDSVTILLRK